MQRPRQMVFVSGAPGAGKTSLAVPLADELGFALVCKDKLKETLHDALGAPRPDLAWSRTLGAAAMELLWALAADAPSVVIEANFRPHDRYQRDRLSALADDPVEVYCACDPVGLDYWIWPGRAAWLGSSLSDLLGRLPARSPSARLSDRAGPG
jgi:predicted kinase